MIIGVTGTDGSGKDTVGRLLWEGLGWPHLSLSDVLRQIAADRGLDTSRETLAELGEDVRTQYGAGYLAKKAAERIVGSFVATSVRHPEEARQFKSKDQFLLVAVDAPLSKRYQRTVERDRAGEAHWTPADFEKHQSDVEFSQREFGQQIDRVMAMADLTIINDGDLDNLKNQVDKIIKEVKMHRRYTWDEYFVAICDTVGGRGTCDRGRSGAVIVKDKRIVSTGYVGSPVGLPHCDEVGHEFKDTVHEDGHVSKHCVRTTHAEQNAICQAARFGTSIDGGTIYCKMTPCYACAKMIINAGIKRVVAQKDYHAGADSQRIFKEAGIQFDVLDDTLEVYADQVGTTPAVV